MRSSCRDPSGAMWKVSDSLRAGWSGGKFSASKLNCSVSTSGPSASSQPIATKVSAMCSARMVIGCRAPIGLAGRGQGDVDGLGHQHRRVAFGAQYRQTLVVAALGVAAGDVDQLAGLGAVLLGQAGQRLAGQRQRRAVTEVLGLGAGQGVQVGGQLEGVPGRADGLGQRFLRQVDGLVTHAARRSFSKPGLFAPRM